MLNIADSRFQDALLAAAKRANKIDAGYRIPERISAATRRSGSRRRSRRQRARRAVLRISVRHGSHARGDRSGARAALAQGTHRGGFAKFDDDRARVVRARARTQHRGYLERLGLAAPAEFQRTADRESREPRARARRARGPSYFANSREGSLNALNSSALPEGS